MSQQPASTMFKKLAPQVYTPRNTTLPLYDFGLRQSTPGEVLLGAPPFQLDRFTTDNIRCNNAKRDYNESASRLHAQEDENSKISKSVFKQVDEYLSSHIDKKLMQKSADDVVRHCLPAAYSLDN